MRLGDRFVNPKGDIITVIAVHRGGWFDWYAIDVECAGVKVEYTRTEVDTFTTNRDWVVLPPRQPKIKGPAVCTKCGTGNTYQDGPFVCWSCRSR